MITNNNVDRISHVGSKSGRRTVNVSKYLTGKGIAKTAVVIEKGSEDEVKFTLEDSEGKRFAGDENLAECLILNKKLINVSAPKEEGMLEDKVTEYARSKKMKGVDLLAMLGLSRPVMDNNDEPQ